MALFWFCFILFVNGYLSAFAQAETQDELSHYIVEVQVVAPDRKGEYVPALLSMILNASKAPDEVIDLLLSDHMLSQARWIAEVQKQDNNNILWTVTSKEREQLLRPIRIPIYKDLWDMRLLVIRKQDEEKFAQIKNKNDLTMYTAGQGAHWPDNAILLANGLGVMLGSGTENLYKMLQAKRFDYFPRSIVEFSAESRFVEASDLVVEKNILLSYPNPMYFFVNKANSELAERIERGWEIIIKNGEFDKFFYADAQVKSALEQLKKYDRQIIRLDNPDLLDDTYASPK
ncbi:MAG: hypothetical protein V4660_08255 [Pseudomonadota bacterium]